MALAVYSRVGSVLQAAGVDLEALRDEIAARYGLTIDLRTLAALALDGRVQRPDIEVLEAVALIVGVRVDDLLDVHAMEPAEAVSVVSDDVLLDAERDARLRDLAELNPISTGIVAGRMKPLARTTATLARLLLAPFAAARVSTPAP